MPLNAISASAVPATRIAPIAISRLRVAGLSKFISRLLAASTANPQRGSVGEQPQPGESVRGPDVLPAADDLPHRLGHLREQQERHATSARGSGGSADGRAISRSRIAIAT